MQSRVKNQSLKQAIDEAINEKLWAPEKEVFCPKCGSPLHISGDGESGVIHCETQGCVSLTFRGL